MPDLNFTLSYQGKLADGHQIDFYDVARALIGFQRSLALTTHLVLNGEVITQATALKGAEIVAFPPEEGSWKVTATIIAGMYTLGTAPPDTVVGHLVRSAYDYVISETIGFHVDFDKTLGVQYEELKKREIELPTPRQSKFDATIEKCEAAILDMHRPIVESETANAALITVQSGRRDEPISRPLTSRTFDYINFTEKGEIPVELSGRVSSYNINTFKGRIFIIEENRPISFELAKSARDSDSVRLISESLAINAQERFEEGSLLLVTAFLNKSRSGRLKSIFIIEVGQ